MKFKKFDDYVKQYSNDIKSFSKMVNFATNESFDIPYFNIAKSSFDLGSYAGCPTIVSEGFMFNSQMLNESVNLTYGNLNIPHIETIYEDFKEEEFSPKSINSIKDIKKIKFPVTAYGKSSNDEYNTLHKLRSCEKIYDRFREKPKAKTKFKVLSFKNNPISIVETINKYPIDVDLYRFGKLNQVKSIVNKIYEKYKTLDFYNLDIIESLDGRLYAINIDKKLNLNPHQAKIVYETAYEDFYESRLPNWVKEELFNESVIPYYKKKALDSKLITSVNSIDYSKYLKND